MLPFCIHNESKASANLQEVGFQFLFINQVQNLPNVVSGSLF